MGNVREPQPHIDAEGGDVRQGNNHHFEGIGPAGEETGQGAKVVAGIMTEGAGDRLMHRHFTQRAHYHKDRRAADQISQQHRRASQLDGSRGAVEQTGADGRAERHKADMPRV